MSGDPKPGDDAGVHPVSKHLLFLDSPKFRNRVFWVLLALVLLLVAAGFSDQIDRHPHFWFEERFNPFHAVYGFIAFVFAVLCGWPLRKLLSRPEDYYGQGDDNG